jgi:hypothetical protein
MCLRVLAFAAEGAGSLGGLNPSQFSFGFERISGLGIVLDY